MPDNQHWVGTWTTAPAPAEGAVFTNQTLRMTARTSLGGDTLRVRLSNAYGSRKLSIGAARVALRGTGPGIVSASDRGQHRRRFALADQTQRRPCRRGVAADDQRLFPDPAPAVRVRSSSC